jgi:chromosome partitioning protein
MIISILNQKGGTGKTTLAVNLAREYTKRTLKTLLVDSDSQGSALRWHEESGGDLIDLTCLPVNTLDKDVVKFKDRYERIIIDGVPRVSPLTVCAIKASDVVLIPVQPSPYDVWATEDLVRLVKERIDITEGKLKAAFVVCRQIKGSLLGREIASLLSPMGLPVFHHGTYQRQEYARSIKEGRTVCENPASEAHIEIAYIANELEDFLSWPKLNPELNLIKMQITKNSLRGW